MTGLRARVWSSVAMIFKILALCLTAAFIPSMSSAQVSETFTFDSSPNNYTVILSNPSGDTITFTNSITNSTCASVSGTALRLFATSSNGGGACDQSNRLTVATSGFDIDTLLFQDIDDMDGTSSRDAFAANVPGTWTSPTPGTVGGTPAGTLSVFPLRGPAPSFINQRRRFISEGAVGDIVFREAGDNPINDSAQFALSTPTDTFVIIHDDAEGSRGSFTSFNLGVIPLVVFFPPDADDELDVPAVAGVATVVDVLDGDTDRDGTLVPASVTITGSSGPGQPLTVSGQGTWSVNTSNGEITFTPGLNPSGNPFVGTPTPITYTVDDNSGRTSNAATVSLQIATPSGLTPVGTGNVLAACTASGSAAISPLVFSGNSGVNGTGNVTSSISGGPQSFASDGQSARIDGGNSAFSLFGDSFTDSDLFISVGDLAGLSETYTQTFSGSEQVFEIYQHGNSFDQLGYEFDPAANPGMGWEVISANTDSNNFNSPGLAASSSSALLLVDVDNADQDATLADEESNVDGLSADFTVRLFRTDGGPISQIVWSLREDPERVSGNPDGYQMAQQICAVPASIGVIKGSVFNDESGDGFAQAGETITYTYTVTNGGAGDLSSIALVETGFTGAGTTPVPVLQSGDDGDGVLQPTETWIYTVSYTLIPADISAGSVDNQATVTGSLPGGSTVSDLSDSTNASDGNGTGTAGGGTDNDDVTTTPLAAAPPPPLSPVGLGNVLGACTASGSAAISPLVFTGNSGVNGTGNVTTTITGGTQSFASDGQSARIDGGNSAFSLFGDSFTDSDLFVSAAALVGFSDTYTQTFSGSEQVYEIYQHGNSFDQLGYEFDPAANPGMGWEVIAANSDTNNQNAPGVASSTSSAVLLVDADNTDQDATLADEQSNADGLSADFTVRLFRTDGGPISQIVWSLREDPDRIIVSPPSPDGLQVAQQICALSSGIGVVKGSVFNDENSDGFAQIGETITYTYTVTNEGAVGLSTITLVETGFTGAGTTPVPVLTPSLRLM